MEYGQYIKNQVGSAFKGQVSPSKHSIYKAPEEFAPLSHYCRGVEDYFPLTPSIKKSRDANVGNAIAFVVMHEVGHIVQQHRISVNPNDFRQHMLCASRKNEKEADVFAVKKLVRYSGPAVILSNSLWDMQVNLASIFPSFEANSTHPSPSRRWAENINLAFKEARRLGVRFDSRLLELSRKALKLQEKIDRELSDNEKILIQIKC